MQKVDSAEEDSVWIQGSGTIKEESLAEGSGTKG